MSEKAFNGFERFTCQDLSNFINIFKLVNFGNKTKACHFLLYQTGVLFAHQILVLEVIFFCAIILALL